MKIADIIKYIELKAPLETQLEYDNCGVKCGNIQDEITGIIICLDTSEDVVDEAIDKGCNLIIEHHPIIFSPLFTLNNVNPAVKTLVKCINNGITIYSAHTNIDLMKKGLNYQYAKKLLSNSNTIDHKLGICFATLNDSIKLGDYVKKLESIFGEKVYYVGDDSKVIRNIACINGAGGNIDNVYNSVANADVLITSEFKHSALMLAKNLQYAIIQVSHYASEIGFLDLMYDLISKIYNSNNIYKSSFCDNPLRGNNE